MAREPVYSLRIFGHAGLTASAGEVGPIVPDQFVYVVRDIDVLERTGAGATLMQVINQTEGPLWEVDGGTTLASRLGQWRGRQVYGPGEKVGFIVTAGEWSIACSGYQLTLP